MQIVDVGRDQKLTELALRALDDVVRRFPDSKYARDAKLKLDFTRDHLAGKEMEIGRYYLKRGEYLAAINRFKRVIDNYQTTTHVPEALERLVECDLALGLTKEAKDNAAVLGYNYPGSRWYGDAYALVTGGGAPPGSGEGWFSRLVSGVF
jgi:outer membrane protein assembly factor BamD